MLFALLPDVAALPDVEPIVLICDAAADDFCFPENVVVERVPNVLAAQLPQTLAEMASRCDAVLPIAPECDGILSAVCASLWAENCRVIGLNQPGLDICCDKWQTFEYCTAHQIPTIPTSLLPVNEAFFSPHQQSVVLKPRLGAGCEGIRQCPISQLSSLSPDQSETLVAQPKIEGRAYSVGMIGQNDPEKPLMLPLAEQHIIWRDGCPGYSGGCILAPSRHRINSGLTAICRKLASTLRLDLGYMGIDLLYLPETNEYLVTEINPRLCTSYIGYRRACIDNLAGMMLFPEFDICPGWRQQNTSFTPNEPEPVD